MPITTKPSKRRTPVAATVPATGRGAIDLKGRRIHFVGIGGCGMSGLARLARQFGAVCTGTDHQATAVTEALQADGIELSFEQTAASVPVDCQLLVASAAIGPNHPEYAEAGRRGVRVLKYAQMLGNLMCGRTGVAIAGTHGKSTTTSLLSHVLIEAGLDPSFIVGANCAQIGGGWRCGGSDLLVAEACEYDRSFHHLHPHHAVILNVEADHLDVYRSLEEVVEAFGLFARRVPPDGSLLINHEMVHRLTIVAGLDCPVETIGFAPQADWRIELMDQLDSGEPGIRLPGGSGSFRATGTVWTRLLHHGRHLAQWPNPLPGEHMAYNAAAAAITACRLGAPWPTIEKAIASFAGLDRRMQWLGRKRIEGGQVEVVDDYGHHPTEIDATLGALRHHYNPARLICVFQPHQHSRTRFLMQQFATSFSEADIVIVPHIYFVRDSEEERHAVQAADLVDRLRQGGRQAMHLYPFDAIVEQLKLIARDGDLVVTMGAGDVWKVAADFLG